MSCNQDVQGPVLPHRPGHFRYDAKNPDHAEMYELGYRDQQAGNPCRTFVSFELTQIYCLGRDNAEWLASR